MAEKLGSGNPENIKKTILESMELNPEQQETADLSSTIREILQSHLPKNPRETTKIVEEEILETFTIPVTNQKIIKTAEGLFLETTLGKMKFYQTLSGTTFEELKTKIESIKTE
ncbi:MAG: hypothetical protein WC025_02080 [Candidatus Magasanikbacteria bacterium]